MFSRCCGLAWAVFRRVCNVVCILFLCPPHHRASTASQYFLLPIILADTFFSLFVANSLYAAAFGVYFYITFLGYTALPFLVRTERFLYPIGIVVLVYATSLALYPAGIAPNFAVLVLGWIME